ncbi:hypothetical protein IJT10_00420 [bacterium]|nr:hypothetical protein [bacterium]
MVTVRESYLERAGLVGCFLPFLIGGILGAVLGYICRPAPVGGAEELEGVAESLTFIYLLCGFGGGSFICSLIAYVLDQWKYNKEEKEISSRLGEE